MKLEETEEGIFSDTFAGRIIKGYWFERHQYGEEFQAHFSIIIIVYLHVWMMLDLKLLGGHRTNRAFPAILAG